MLAAEPTESTDATQPADPIDKIDPAEPMDRIDPAEPIDRIDPVDPMLKMEPSVFRMRPFSQGPPLPGPRSRPSCGTVGCSRKAWMPHSCSSYCMDEASTPYPQERQAPKRLTTWRDTC